MFTFDVANLFPRFLLNDKNGYAIAKAIEAGLKFFLAKCQDGIDCVLDIEKMPEWRLDEMAWELNCLYDYTAGIETKRQWIRDAVPLFAAYGTPSAIYKYLAGYFEEVEVEENWQYGGDPFHFRVNVSGEWTPANEAWARRAIAATQNVRSVLDDLRVGCSIAIGIAATGEIKERFRYPCAGEIVAGEYPTENIIWEIDETPNAGIDAEAEAGRVVYRMAGTYPEIAHGLVIDGTPMEAQEAEEIITPVYYPMCGEFSCGEIE